MLANVSCVLRMVPDDGRLQLHYLSEPFSRPFCANFSVRREIQQMQNGFSPAAQGHGKRLCYIAFFVASQDWSKLERQLQEQEKRQQEMEMAAKLEADIEEEKENQEKERKKTEDEDAKRQSKFAQYTQLQKEEERATQVCFFSSCVPRRRGKSPQRGC